MRLLAALLVAVAIFGSSVPPRVNRNQLAKLEQITDSSIIGLPDEAGFLLGATRAVYLEGYGTVFTTEVDLIPTAAPHPFRPAYTPADIQKIKAKKRERIEQLKAKMTEVMVSSAQPLDSVPLVEKVALAVTIPYYNWEDKAGMPRQILMEAQRGVLLQGARGDMAAVKKATRIQEF